MSELESLWAKADIGRKEQQRDFEEMPTGVYKVRLEATGLNKDKTPAKVDVRYRVLEGKFQNRVLFAGFTLNEVGTSILKKELSKLGYNGTPSSYEALEAALATYVGSDLEVFAKHRNYTKKDGSTGSAHNVYVNTKEVSTNSELEEDEILF